METQAKMRGQRTRVTSMAQKPVVEPQTRGTEDETGARQTGATMKGVRMMGKQEGRRSPVEPKGWRVEVQPETWKSMAEAERRSPEESWG